MKKILIIFNHMQLTDGVARTAFSLANELCKLPEISVTLCPLFRFNEDTLDLLDSRIIVKPVFKRYFRGFPKLIGLIPRKPLYKFIFKEKYDIEIGYAALLPAELVASSSNSESKKYLWIHTDVEGNKLKNECSKFYKTVCVSKYIRDKLKNEISGDLKIEYAYNLVDSNKIIQDGKENIEDCIFSKKTSKLRLITVCRLSPQKSLDRLIRCVHRLKKNSFDLELLIIGRGRERSNIENLIENLNLQDTVYLLDAKKNPHAYTSKADLFVCSSYYEGYSTACTEALILGVPFISTDVSGAKEMQEESQCGLVVENDEEQLYLGLKNVLENPSVIQEWRDKLNTTKYNFSKEKRVEKLLDVLELN